MPNGIGIRAQDDLLTLAAIGVTAVVVAAFAHEAVGHGGACAINGGEITLLSVIWFRCSISAPIIDLAGPVVGLVTGLSGLALAAWAAPSALRARIFGLLIGSFATFWFSAQLASQVLSGLDDWQSAAAWPLGWRAVAMTTGAGIYGATVFGVWALAARIGGGHAAGRRFIVPYAAGALVLVLCAALRWQDGSALETVRAVGLAPLGFLWAVTRRSVAHGDGPVVDRSWPWITAGLAGVMLYATVFGPGIGSAA